MKEQQELLDSVGLDADEANRRVLKPIYLASPLGRGGGEAVGEGFYLLSFHRGCLFYLRPAQAARLYFPPLKGEVDLPKAKTEGSVAPTRRRYTVGASPCPTVKHLFTATRPFGPWPSALKKDEGGSASLTLRKLL